jgi:hypothetical protein
MPLKITNVALDPAFALKRRMAKSARLEMEPLIAGQRLRLRQSMTISDEQFRNNEERLHRYWDMGVIHIEEASDRPSGAAPKAPAPPPLPKIEEPEPEPVTLPEPEPELPVTVEPEIEWEEPPAEEPEPEPAPAPKATKKKKSSKKGSKK